MGETVYVGIASKLQRDQFLALQENVFAFDSRIRFCALLDTAGRIAAGGMRPGLKSLEPGEEAERIDVQMALSGGCFALLAST